MPNQPGLVQVFFCSVNTDKGIAHLVVSNKHVLANADELEFEILTQSPEGKPNLGETEKFTITTKGQDYYHGHKEGSVDVAVMPISSILGSSKKLLFYKTLDEELFTDDTFLSGLDALEEVSFVGYPGGLYDTKNVLPILRSGHTATPVMVDYGGSKAFLVDASVFPGSSGSPVFLYNKGMYANRTGGTVIGTRFKLLGILSAVHTRSIKGKLIEIPATQIATLTEEVMDLGIVYKASTIAECIDELLNKVGLKRAVVTPSSTPDNKQTEADEQIAEKME